MSRIVVKENYTIFEGPDAVRLMQAKTVKVAIRLAMRGVKIHRKIGIKKLLETATSITAKKYKRDQGDAVINDLEQWIVAMEAALPVHNERMEK